MPTAHQPKRKAEKAGGEGRAAGGGVIGRAARRAVGLNAKEVTEFYDMVEAAVTAAQKEVAKSGKAAIKPIREALLAQQEREGVYLGRVTALLGAGRLRIQAQQEYRDAAGVLADNNIPIRKGVAVHGRSVNKWDRPNVMLPGCTAIVSGGWASARVPPGIAQELADFYEYLEIPVPPGFFGGAAATEEEEEGYIIDHGEEEEVDMADL